MKVQVPNKIECTRCHHRWMPRKETVTVCPVCRSPYWNQERVIKQKKEK